MWPPCQTGFDFFLRFFVGAMSASQKTEVVRRFLALRRDDVELAAELRGLMVAELVDLGCTAKEAGRLLPSVDEAALEAARVRRRRLELVALVRENPHALLDEEQLAMVLGVTVNAMRMLAKAGNGPFCLGRASLARPEWVVEWLAQNKSWMPSVEK